MFKQAYVHPLSHQRYGDWTWCIRCQCVYRTAKWFADHWFCPHPGCDGTAHDSFRWRHKNAPPCDFHPHYPAVPVEGQRYIWRLPETEKHKQHHSGRRIVLLVERFTA